MKRLCNFCLCGIVILIVVAGCWIPKLSPAGNPDTIGLYRCISWLVILGLMALFTIILGVRITGLGRGVFVDERKQISLSRVQTVVWTLLLISAWLAAVFSNYAVGKDRIGAAGNPPTPPTAPSPPPEGFTLTPRAASPGDTVILTGDAIVERVADQDVTFDGLRPIERKMTFGGAVEPAAFKWFPGEIYFHVPDRGPDGNDWTPNQEVKISLSSAATPAPEATPLPKATLVVTSRTNAFVSEKLDVAIPAELWAAMGISIVSLVGSPLILNTKRDRFPNAAQREETLTVANSSRGLLREASVPQLTNDPATDGLVVTKVDQSDAEFADMFRGEETGNADKLDLAKVQMFFFTVALVSAYGIALGAMFLSSKNTVILSLPGLSAGFVALLGISHAGYLGSKAAPHSKEEAQPETPDSALKPATAIPGSTITIQGANFGASADGKSVLFDGTALDPALVTTWTNTVIALTVPAKIPGSGADWPAGETTVQVSLSGAALKTPDKSGKLPLKVQPTPANPAP